MATAAYITEEILLTDHILLQFLISKVISNSIKIKRFLILLIILKNLFSKGMNQILHKLITYGFVFAFLSLLNVQPGKSFL